MSTTTPQSTPDEFRAVRDWANELLNQAHSTGAIPTAGADEIVTGKPTPELQLCCPQYTT